jgi:hypothetical protein
MNSTGSRPAFVIRIVELGGETLPGSSQEFGKLIASEAEKWARVVKFAGVRAE